MAVNGITGWRPGQYRRPAVSRPRPRLLAVSDQAEPGKNHAKRHDPSERQKYQCYRSQKMFKDIFWLLRFHLAVEASSLECEHRASLGQRAHRPARLQSWPPAKTSRLLPLVRGAKPHPASLFSPIIRRGRTLVQPRDCRCVVDPRSSRREGSGYRLIWRERVPSLGAISFPRPALQSKGPPPAGRPRKCP